MKTRWMESGVASDLVRHDQSELNLFNNDCSISTLYLDPIGPELEKIPTNYSTPFLLKFVSFV